MTLPTDRPWLAAAAFRNFRGFERLNADLSPHAFVVGPNSAGKSTIIEAIGLATTCLDRARRQRPTLPVRLDGEPWAGSYLPQASNEDEEGEDPIRFDFGTAEATVTVTWTNGAFFRAVWPEEDRNEEPHFVLVGPGGTKVRPADVPVVFGRVATVPVITPLERIEDLKNVAYVRKHAGGRLASRHFRNHLRLMTEDGTFDDFRRFAEPWLPEMGIEEVLFEPSANRLGVFYREAGSRIPKELAWAGDGMQIWVQLLWHIWRARGVDTIVLDEPEVYLHPDLQRRLVRLLTTVGTQIVLASHSAEVLAEAPPDAVLWIDRRKNYSRKAKNPESLAALRTSLGSTYNLQLARANRAALIIATDVDDPRVLRALARATGALRVADEEAVAVLRLREPASWGNNGLAAELEHLLPGDVPHVVLVLQGQQPLEVTRELLGTVGFSPGKARILPMAQLANALLCAPAIARVTGTATEAVLDRLMEIVRRLHDQSRAAFIGNAVKVRSGHDPPLVAADAGRAFDEIWRTPKGPLRLVRASAVMLELNAWMAQEGYRLLDEVKVARGLRPHELDSAVYEVLLDLDGIAAG